ncbi:hypothetical protein [Frankia sp. Cr2]|uniref:hypothetical protein n=1 Tax=Frankia sp. Cr2 TaxID=3073932 RepID=UPI002AD4E7B0|nr:hypothetical protein [Frankia sp. Cr2]
MDVRWGSPGLVTWARMSVDVCWRSWLFVGWAVSVAVIVAGRARPMPVDRLVSGGLGGSGMLGV